LSILDLTHRDSLSEAKQRYRQLAMQHHPDRGGNAALFQEVQWAFSILQRQQK
jgi:DnaJ-class molecular chaperone